FRTERRDHRIHRPTILQRETQNDGSEGHGMTISVKATKTDAANPTTSRDRYLLKGAIFSKTPIYIGVLMAAVLLYLRSLFPTVAEQAPPEEDKRAPEPDEQPVTETETAYVELPGPQPEEDRREKEATSDSS